MKSYKSSDIDPKKVRISKVCKPFTAGTKEITKIEIKYGNEPLHILGPKMYCPFGLGQFPKPEDVRQYTKVKYTIQMNFKGHKEGFENAKSTEELYNLFDDIDLVLKEQLLQKSGEFLNQPTTEFSLIDKMYTRLIQTPEKEEYDPFFRLKMPTEPRNQKEFKVGFFDDKQNPLKMDVDKLRSHLEDRRWIRPIIKLDCLWYIESKIYPNIEAELLKIYNEVEKREKKEEKEPKKKDKGKSKPKTKKIEFL